MVMTEGTAFLETFDLSPDANVSVSLQKELGKQTDCPYMCAYKLVTVKFKWWGLQNKVENFIQKVSELFDGERCGNEASSPTCSGPSASANSVFCLMILNTLMSPQAIQSRPLPDTLQGVKVGFSLVVL